MAKITLENGMVIEGTVEELKEMAKSFVELKGYRKVDRNAEVGDLVKFSENVCDVTPGKYYEIIKLDSDGDPLIIDDIDDEYCLYGDEESFEVYEKVAPCCEETKHETLKEAELKVGDFAKVVELAGGEIYTVVGDIVKINDITSSDFVKYTVLRNGLDSSMYAHRFTKATDEEVAEAKRAEKWAKIGRKPNEFKEGDVVLINDPCGAPLSSGQIVEVKYDSNNKNCVSVVGERGWLVTVSELITPVESRFDRA